MICINCSLWQVCVMSTERKIRVMLIISTKVCDFSQSVFNNLFLNLLIVFSNLFCGFLFVSRQFQFAQSVSSLVGKSEKDWFRTVCGLGRHSTTKTKLNPFAPNPARNRQWRSASLLPLVTSSALMVKDNFDR